MATLRYYYSDTISMFLTRSTDEIVGKLTLASQHDTVSYTHLTLPTICSV